uniref:Uncharacterized protein n=1 Tax=Arion vulgaris TaxID=1028688 RepID=A0A0B7AH14_9EUPU
MLWPLQITPEYKAATYNQICFHMNGQFLTGVFTSFVSSYSRRTIASEKCLPL